MTHEVVHLSLGRALGGRAATRLPYWKTEGYADYQTHRASILADPAYSLGDRIRLLLDDDRWSGAARERRLLRWQLLVEYLVCVKGLGLRDIADEAEVEPAVYGDMLEWHRVARGPR